MNIERLPHTTDEKPVGLRDGTRVMYWLENDTAAYVDFACSVAWGLRGEPGRVEWYAVVPSA